LPEPQLNITNSNYLVNLTSLNYLSPPNNLTTHPFTPPTPQTPIYNTPSLTLPTNSDSTSSTNFDSTHTYPEASPPFNKRRKSSTIPYSPGELGKWAKEHARALAQMGWNNYFHFVRHPHSLSPNIQNLSHPAAPYLTHLANIGATTAFPENWSTQQCDHAYERGPHPSAAQRYKAFLLADMFDYVQMGYWTVLPYNAVRHLPSLRLAPAGVVPQRERHPRPIMDYSFFRTNQEGHSHAPKHAMQFGKALSRILQRLVYCDPTHGPPRLAKIDLADGYYRVPISAQAALNLAVVIPSDIPENPSPLIAIPLSLPMGWADSPPYFCAVTETIADMANTPAYAASHTATHHSLHTTQVSPHPLPAEAAYHPTATVLEQLGQRPLPYTDVYLDDFMVLTQTPNSLPAMNCLLHAIDDVFHDPKHSNRRNIVSTSKLAKGEATFSTKKRLLGWDIDTHMMTLTLPQHRLETLIDHISSFLPKKRTSRRQWQRLLGTLRSTTPALYGAEHLFSLLQHVLTDQLRPRLRLSSLIKESLEDWLRLAQTAVEHPVPLHTLVPRKPTILSATDASGMGMGGFWLSPTQRCLWRAPFPTSVRQELITATNVSGTLTNSDLEHAALLTGAVHCAQNLPSLYDNILIASDNTSAVAWATRGSTTTTKAPAYLLPLFAQQRHATPFTLTACFTPGDSNQLADASSRLFHLSDSEFLTHMNKSFPTQPSWILVPPPPGLLSAMNSALLKQRLPKASLMEDKTQTRPHGISGPNSVWPSTKTRISQPSTTQSHYYKSSPIDIDQAHWLPVGIKYVLEQWKAPFAPLDRRSPNWDNKTPDCYPPVNWISDYHACSPHTKKKTHLQAESSRFLSQF